MSRSRVQLTVDLPTAQASAMIAAVRAFTAVSDGSIVKATARAYSPQLRGLGMSANLVETLVGLEIETPEELGAKPEEELLAVPGINYASIQKIERALHEYYQSTGLGREGRMLERLDLTASRYRTLRFHGVHTIEDLTALDGIDLLGMGFDSKEVKQIRGALADQRLALADKLDQRTLGDLNLRVEGMPFLERVQDRPLAGATTASLRRMLVEAGLHPDDPSGFHPALLRMLEDLGYVLPAHD